MTASPPSPIAPIEPRPAGCAGSVVCHCHQVTEVAVRTAIDAVGARSVEEITLSTRAGGSCRGCHCRLNRMLAGLPPHCGRFAALCRQCGCIEAICACRAA